MMAMNNEKIIQLVEEFGVAKIPHSKLLAAYSFITKKAMSGSCSGCAKRKAMGIVQRHYNKLKEEENDKAESKEIKESK